MVCVTGAFAALIDFADVFVGDALADLGHVLVDRLERTAAASMSTAADALLSPAAAVRAVWTGWVSAGVELSVSGSTKRAHATLVATDMKLDGVNVQADDDMPAAWDHSIEAAVRGYALWFLLWRTLDREVDSAGDASDCDVQATQIFKSAVFTVASQRNQQLVLQVLDVSFDCD
jgi:hypothetical protein